MKKAVAGFVRFIATHKRWWLFLSLVVILCAILVFFGQTSSLTSFIYALF